MTIKLGGQKYRILEVSPAHSASLISAKKCRRLIAQTGTFVLLMIRPEEQKKNVCNSHSMVSITTEQQRSTDQILAKYQNVFELPTRVPSHCQVRHSIDLIPGTPFPNEPVYRRSVLENDEIKRQIQELI